MRSPQAATKAIIRRGTLNDTSNSEEVWFGFVLFFNRAVTAAAAAPPLPPPLANPPVNQAGPPRGRGAPVPSVCGSGGGGAHLDVEVGGVEAPRRDEPGLGRPQVPRHQLPGPLHQELTVPLRRHLAPGPARLRPGRRAARMRRGALRAGPARASAPLGRSLAAILEAGKGWPLLWAGPSSVTDGKRSGTLPCQNWCCCR